jgi:hypothetical protein
LAFDLTFETGDLVVGFLRSYAHLAQAEVWVTDLTEAQQTADAHSRPSSSAVGLGKQGRLSAAGELLANRPAVLHGLWEEHKSELAKAQLSGVGHGKLRVHVRTKCDDPNATCKFKLLMLLAC